MNVPKAGTKGALTISIAYFVVSVFLTLIFWSDCWRIDCYLLGVGFGLAFGDLMEEIILSRKNRRSGSSDK